MSDPCLSSFRLELKGAQRSKRMVVYFIFYYLLVSLETGLYLNQAMNEKSECIGCKVTIDQGFSLPLPNISFDIKDYTFPIKDHRDKWNLLKTICSLLNSKGGTIVIGADEKAGTVKGLKIKRKSQDDFKLFLQQLTERIEPKIDLSHQEQMLVQFVPVVRGQSPTGKYIIKILVQQGIPTETYCFVQKIHLDSAIDKKSEEFEIIYGFKKLSTGIKEYKGLELIEEIKKKALSPPEKVKTFHQNCNPQPALIESQKQVRKIKFAKIPNIETLEKLEKWFEYFLKDQKLKQQSYSLEVEQKSPCIVVKIVEKSDFDRVFSFVLNNISKLNDHLSECKFERKTIHDEDDECDFYLFENQASKIHDKKSSSKKKEKKKRIEEREEEEEEDVDEFEYEEGFFSDAKKEKINHEIRKIQQVAPKIQSENRKNQKDLRIIQAPKGEKVNKNLSITFTHIQPKKSHELIQRIQGLLECPKQIQSYTNSVQLYFTSREEYLTYLSILEMEESQFSQFGFNNKIIMGKNSGILEIRNYDNKKYKELKKYVEKEMGSDLKGCRYTQEAHKFRLLIEMKKPSLACIWLDKLLSDFRIKSFQIPGAEKGQSAKMKFEIVCAKISDIQNY